MVSTNRSLSSSLCSFRHSPVTSSVLSPNVYLSTLVSYNLILGTTLNAWDQALHPYKKANKTVLVRKLRTDEFQECWLLCRLEFCLPVCCLRTNFTETQLCRVQWGWLTWSALENLVQGTVEDCVKVSLWLVLYTENCVVADIREKWMGGACGRHDGEWNAEKHAWRGLLVKRGRKSEDNIRMDVKCISWKGLIWISLTLGRDNWWKGQFNKLYWEPLKDCGPCSCLIVCVYEGLLCEMTSETCFLSATTSRQLVEFSWNMMEHGDELEGK